jgi:N-dimethylarginine dimethylaminohydrolase
MFPDAILASHEDASVLGLNAFSDGRNVVLPRSASRLIARLRESGFHPIGLELSELLKAGGSVKCCTLELR